MAARSKKISIPALMGVVLGYQVLGTLAEWVMKGSLYAAAQDFRIGIPGILLQIFGGYLFLKMLARR